MPTTIYDNSLITQRRKDKAQSGSFISRISPWNSSNITSQPTTGYGPLLGIYDQSVINNVKNGNIKYFRKGEGCTTINNGCPCNPLSSAQVACCGTN